MIALAQQQQCWLYIRASKAHIYPEYNLVITTLCSYVEKIVSVSIWIIQAEQKHKAAAPPGQSESFKNPFIK